MKMTIRKTLIFSLSSVIILGLTYCSPGEPKKEETSVRESSLEKEFLEGDLIFQTSESTQSRAIQIASRSKYIHMGVVYKKDDRFYVFEAVQPVKLTPLDEWINRGKDAHYVVKRIKGSDTLLTHENLLKMKQVGEKYIGKDYDLYFEWSDERMYCSELVWKIYKETLGLEIGELRRLDDFDLTDKLVRQKLKERYGDQLPLDELIISPASMYESNKLQTVFSN